MERRLPYAVLEDARGRFVGITQESWAEVNYIETTAGKTRGGHYHEHIRELFFIISGVVDVTIHDLRSGDSTELRVSAGDLLLVEPLEVHTFRTRTAAQWLNMLSRSLDPRAPDFHRPGETP